MPVPSQGANTSAAVAYDAVLVPALHCAVLTRRYFFVQYHITPQIRNAAGYSVNGQKGDLENFQVPGPQYPENAADASRVLKQSTDEVSQQGQARTIHAFWP